MPTSGPYFINEICEEIMYKKPMTILDVGIGFGKFGFLAREYTDIWADRYYRSDWQVRIDGIEVFEEYIMDSMYRYYNNIYIGDALKVFKENRHVLKKYDMIICVDVLEHFEKDDGRTLLEHFKNRGKTSLVVLPINPSDQKKVHGNEYETHRSKWKQEELEEWGGVVRKGSAFMLEIT